ncbi:MAG: helix-turn-helix transcriptional regulator [Pyrinomonadaceae bacterium]
MKRIDSRAAALLLAALEHLNSDPDPATLAERAVGAAAMIVKCDLVSFELFSPTPRYEHTVWANDRLLLDPAFMKPFGELLHQHPIVKLSITNPNGEAIKITDAVSQAKFERTDLYNVVFRPVHVNKQMGLGLLSEGDLVMTCAFTRGGSDFSEHEKTIATLAAPHFVNAIRNGFAFGRISAAMQAGGQGVVALGSAGRTTFASSHARTLLEKYFPAETLAADSLPQTLSGWIRAARLRSGGSEYSLPVEPYCAQNPDGSRLTVRLLDNRSTREELLLLEEKRSCRPDDFRPFGLTARECEILCWITEGKTDPTIAALCNISVRTVEKHVENIYKKLGVETRTAALSKAMTVI